MRIAPPIAFAIAAVSQRLIAGGSRPTPASKAVALAIGSASASMLSTAAWRFVAARTSLNPHRVDAVSTLVTDGWHARSRNPMYLGFAGVLVSHAVARRSIVALVPAAAFAYYLDRYQIPAEEAALENTFGEHFRDYRDRVPRWIDGRTLHPVPVTPLSRP